MTLKKTMPRSAKLDIISLSSLTAAAALAALLPACGDPSADDREPTEEGYLSERAGSLVGSVKHDDPCAGVRCRSGFVCEEQNGSPVCVATPPPPSCEIDDDCSLVASYCGDCSCSAVRSGEREPMCHGDVVECAVWPCLGLTAACQDGTCVVTNL